MTITANEKERKNDISFCEYNISMTEIENYGAFVPLKGYEGLYEISTRGYVYSVKLNKILKGTKNKVSGYNTIHLTSRNGKKQNQYIHRLVAMTFIENTNNLPQIDHKNRIRDDNRITNLRWVSTSENNYNRIFYKKPQDEYTKLKWKFHNITPKVIRKSKYNIEDEMTMNTLNGNEPKWVFEI